MQLARHGKEKKEQEEQGNNPCSMLTLSPRHADIYRARRSLKSEVLRRSRLFLFKFVFLGPIHGSRCISFSLPYLADESLLQVYCTVPYSTIRMGAFMWEVGWGHPDRGRLRSLLAARIFHADVGPTSDSMERRLRMCMTSSASPLRRWHMIGGGSSALDRRLRRYLPRRSRTRGA